MCVAGHNALMSGQTEVSKFLVLSVSTEHNAHNIFYVDTFLGHKYGVESTADFALMKRQVKLSRI